MTPGAAIVLAFEDHCGVIAAVINSSAGSNDR
jgi:hypothetical protein